MDKSHWLYIRKKALLKERDLIYKHVVHDDRGNYFLREHRYGDGIVSDCCKTVQRLLKEHRVNWGSHVGDGFENHYEGGGAWALDIGSLRDAMNEASAIVNFVEEVKPVREMLMQAGMVRVDGLTVKTAFGQKFVSEAMSKECRRYDSNNGKFAIAIEGELWLGIDSVIRAEKVYQPLIEKLKLERGCWVPCSNGEKLDPDDLLERLANPDWVCPRITS